MGSIEQSKVKVGYIPIIDCAPVILADQLGAFDRQGLEVEIQREVSWANVRDKLALGVLDAAHILAPLPLAITLGIDSVTVPLVNLMTLEVNGNALTLSNALWQEIEEVVPELAATRPLDARAIAAVVRKRAAAGRPQLVLASVFPYSVQNYMVRLWLSSGGLDPDRNVRYKDSVEDRVHALLSARLQNIHQIFGQLPDVLEDVWVNVALGQIEKA